MKKILLILFLAVINMTAFSQPTYSNIGSPFGNNMQRLNALKGLYIPKYNDTTSAYIANLDSLGLIIQVKGTYPNKIYFRDSVSTGGHKWTEIGSGSGSATTFFGLTDVDTTGGLTDGNLFAFQRSTGKLVPYTIGMVTTGTVYYAIDSLNPPPSSPSTGDVYMVGGAGTLAWAGHNYDIATWGGASWSFTDPATGDVAVVTSTKKTYKYTGSTWMITGGIPLLLGGNNLVSGLQFGTLTNVANTWIVNGLQRMRVTGTEIIFNRGSNAYTFPSGRGTSGQFLQTDGAGTLSWATASGGTSYTRQVITSGSSGTVTGGNYIVTIDPASTLASYTLTLPASPSDLDIVEVDFGGTLTSGIVVTTLVIAPNSGQTILDNTPPLSAMADNTILYRYRASNTKWYRFKP